MFNSILGGSYVTCKFMIVGQDYFDQQFHKWTFGPTPAFVPGALKTIPATWTLTGGGSDDNYPQGWTNMGTLSETFSYSIPPNTTTLSIGCSHNGYGTAFDNRDMMTSLGQVAPLIWPPELKYWSLNQSGPLTPGSPIFHRGFVGGTVVKGVQLGGSVVTVSGKQRGPLEYFIGGTWGADEHGNCSHTASWYWTILVQ